MRIGVAWLEVAIDRVALKAVSDSPVRDAGFVGCVEGFANAVLQAYSSDSLICTQ